MSLRVDELTVYYGSLRGDVKAVDGATFALADGEIMGLAGESGCGKSTLGRAVLRLLPQVAGRVVWLGQDLAQLSHAAMRQKRQEMQIIFQDPLASLNPRMTVGEIIGEPLDTFQPNLPAAAGKKMVQDMMAKVGLLPQQINRYPHEFSGGQCQRIGIARAMINNPKLIVCDEPVSALDVSIQAQIINLLEDLQRRLGLTYLFIAHDLSVVRHISDRVAVMYLGKICEIAPSEVLYREPAHPYTNALLGSIPVPDPKHPPGEEVLAGELPSPIDPPSGCRFHTRCPRRQLLPDGGGGWLLAHAVRVRSTDDPGIARFEPRPVAIASPRPAGREWLNGPLVWAIDACHAPMYLFPRDCPRILVWPFAETTQEDRARWFGACRARMIAHVERAWWERLRTEARCLQLLCCDRCRILGALAILIQGGKDWGLRALTRSFERWTPLRLRRVDLARWCLGATLRAGGSERLGCDRAAR